jgi:hypothetical protein
MCVSLVHVDQNLNVCPIKIVDPAVSVATLILQDRTCSRGTCKLSKAPRVYTPKPVLLPTIPPDQCLSLGLD